jgi:hypothetical protein
MANFQNCWVKVPAAEGQWPRTRVDGGRPPQKFFTPPPPPRRFPWPRVTQSKIFSYVLGPTSRSAASAGSDLDQDAGGRQRPKNF